ncbi:MAG: thiamine pyrophosphate-requiring protein [Alphaproteobacteria bacterium]
MNGAALVAEILKREGTEFISCYPRNPVIEECAKLGIRPILCRQERVGVGIADGYTRIMRGKVNGVFAAQAGPGIENAFPGVAQAFSENVPILILPGGLGSSRQYRHPTFSAVDVFAPITKWSARAHSVEVIPDLMRQAYHAMRTGKGGPVLLEIPLEVWDEKFNGELTYEPVKTYPLAPDPSAIAEGVRMLLEAKNPILWAGQGVLYAEASEAVARLAELIPAPVMMTNPGKSAIPENHPLSLGGSTRSRPRMVSEFMDRADLVFAIGSSLTITNFGPKVPSGKRIVHSTNDPSDINKDYLADHAVIGDAKMVAEALIVEIKRQRGEADFSAIQALRKDIATVKAGWIADWKDHRTSEEVPINQYRVIQDLMDTIDRDNVIITHDSGSPREQMMSSWESTKAGSYMGWGKSTQLGYGLGINLGAKIAAPDKICINVMGDAAIGMTGMDLETASRNKIATLTIVFNNSVMAAERDVLVLATKKYGAMDVGGNYAKVAEGLNVHSRRVEMPEDIIPAIKEAVAVVEGGAPFLLEFVVKQGYDFSRDKVAGL